MSQRLLLPFRRSMIICGYKTAQYQKSWGFPHYGIDISTYQGVVQQDHSIRASGDGTIVAVGKDGTLGIGIAIVYNGCISRDGTQKNLVARYMHIKTCYVTVGQTVKAGQIIAEEGKEGTSSYHLHFELDTDTRWPVYTPQVSSTNHAFWKKGTDSTVNPSLWLWQQSGEAMQQPYNFSNMAWINANIDDNIPFIPSEAAEDAAELRRLLEERDKTIVEKDKQIASLTALVNKFRSTAKEAASW